MISRLMFLIKKNINTMRELLKHGLNVKNADTVSSQVLEKWCETWTLKNKAFNIFSWKCLKTLNRILVCYLYDKLADTYEFKERKLFKCSDINLKKKEKRLYSKYLGCWYNCIPKSRMQWCEKKMQAPNCVCEWYSRLRNIS